MSSLTQEAVAAMVGDVQSKTAELRMRNHELMFEVSKLRRELNKFINKDVLAKKRQLNWVPEATLREVQKDLAAEQKTRLRMCGEGLDTCTDVELRELRDQLEKGLDRVVLAMGHRLCGNSLNASAEDELRQLRNQLEKGLERVVLAMERIAAEPRVLQRHPDYKCPLSLGLMRDPVVTAEGQSYERTEIEKWFKQCRDNNEPLTSPLRAPLASDVLIPNNSLRRAIEDALDLEVGMFEIAVQLQLDQSRAGGKAKRARTEN